jgi:hypothetical protein
LELHCGELPSASFTLWFPLLWGYPGSSLIAGWMGPTAPYRRG